MNTSLKWNQKPKPSSEIAGGFRLDTGNPLGIMCGEHQRLPLEAGHKLKAGTLLTLSGAVLIPHAGFCERNVLTFDTAALTATPTKVVQLVIAGITLSSVGEVLNLSSILTFFSAATPGATAASILAASGLTGVVTASGTFGTWYTLTDTANKSLMFVSSRLGVNETALSFTLADTAAVPVDLSSHASITNTALSSAVVHGVLATEADTTSGIMSVPTYTKAEFYSDFPALFVEPDSEDLMVNGALPDMLAMGLYNFEALSSVFLGTKFEVYNSLSPLV
jgi:hypothetical protein